MPVDRANLAGDVEARDRFFHRIEDALFDVVLGAALGIVDDGPGFNDVERRVLIGIFVFRVSLLPRSLDRDAWLAF
jgi:hypothetical protein